MSNKVEQFEKKQIEKMTINKEIPDFKAGDTVRVDVRIIDGANERIQKYEGVVIAVRNRGLTSSFMVRKVSGGHGVERRFMTYSPLVSKVTVVKRGVVRRAKLFYLRNLKGKAARIPEKLFFNSKKNNAAKNNAANVNSSPATSQTETKKAAEAPAKKATTKAKAKKD